MFRQWQAFVAPVLLVALVFLRGRAQGWAGLHPSSRGSCSGGRIGGTALTMVDPASILAGVGEMDVALEVGVALAGVAAGAASQIPRVQAVQKQLAAAQEQLNATETAMNEQIHVLEEKLFAMDQEFEGQTARFQRQYDQTQKKRLEEIRDKLKTEMQYKLEIQLAQEKSKRLMEAVTEEHSRTSKQEELSQLKLRSSHLEELNAELEATLKKTDEELQHLREQAAHKKGRFFFW